MDQNLNTRKLQHKLVQRYKTVTVLPLQGRYLHSSKVLVQECRQPAQHKKRGAGIKKMYGKTELRKNFFSVRVIDAWNKVPPEMKQIAKTEVFKKSYRKLRAT